MKYFEFIFSLLPMAYNALNVDFFGLGFGYIDILLTFSLVLLFFHFLTRGIQNGTNESMSRLGLDVSNKIKISNEKREKQLLKEQKKNIRR